VPTTVGPNWIKEYQAAAIARRKPLSVRCAAEVAVHVRTVAD